MTGGCHTFSALPAGSTIDTVTSAMIEIALEHELAKYVTHQGPTRSFEIPPRAYELLNELHAHPTDDPTSTATFRAYQEVLNEALLDHARAGAADGNRKYLKQNLEYYTWLKRHLDQPGGLARIPPKAPPVAPSGTAHDSAGVFGKYFATFFGATTRSAHTDT